VHFVGLFLSSKYLFADTRYLMEVQKEGSGLHEGRSISYFVTNPQILQQALNSSERSLCHIVHELHHFNLCNRNAYSRSN